MAFPNQVMAASNILNAFESVRYAILKARCQSGKTGAYQALIKFMLDKGVIDHAYILCGSSEVELKEQAKSDTKEHNEHYYNTGKITVLFRQDFDKANLNVTNALIVVDESHLDQSRGQQLDKFLARYTITMDGNPAPLEANNTFIVSVDATPYSELAALQHKETPFKKHVEDLIAGEDYYGLSDYKGEGKLRATFDVSANPQRFADMLSAQRGKYVLIRLTTGKKSSASEVAIKGCCQRGGHKFLLYTSEKTEITMSNRERLLYPGVPCLEDVPPAGVATVVMIRGRLRAGKVVPKHHVGFVWEGAKTSKTDSLVQGLPGRMCGYRSAGAGKADVYVPPSALADYEDKIVKASEIDRAILEYPFMLPMKGTNLKKARVPLKPANGTTECPPLRLSWGAEEAEDFAFTEKFEGEYETGRSRLAIGVSCHKLLMKNLHLIQESSNFSAEQKAEILEQIESADLYAPRTFAVRHLNEQKQLNWFKKLISANATNTAAGEPIGDCLPLNFAVTYRGYKGAYANPKYIYVIFYTRAGPELGLGSVSIKSRIPSTNGKSIFSTHDRHADTPPTAVADACFSARALSTPETMEHTFKKYLTLWKTSTPDTSGFTFARCIKGVQDRFSLPKDKFHHISSKDNDVEQICRRLSAEFGIKMKVLYPPGRHSATAFNVKSISW